MGSHLAIQLNSQTDEALRNRSGKFASYLLSRRLGEINGLCKRLKLKPFDDYVSATADQIEESAIDLGKEKDPESWPKELWFASSEGLQTVQGLLRAVMSGSVPIANDGEIVRNLLDLEAILHDAATQNVLFHFYFD
jgi:hypothetical protein